MIIKKEKAFILPTGLIILLIMTLMVLYNMGSSILEERTSGGMEDRDVSFQNAETALRYAENYIYSTNLNLGAFNASCNGGLCYPSTTSVQNWNGINWATDTTHTLQVPASVTPKAYSPPKFMIEFLGAAPASSGQSAKISSSNSPGSVFRITVYATGNRASTVSMLQSVYMKQ
jgi:type IV pilus assembly protein PilX